MATFNHQDFILKSIYESLKVKHKCSMFERLADKSNAWKSYIYDFNKKFLGILKIIFEDNNNNTLKPFNIRIVFNCEEKRLTEECWNENALQNYFCYSRNIDTKDNNYLKNMNNCIYKIIVNLEKKNNIWYFL